MKLEVPPGLPYLTIILQLWVYRLAVRVMCNLSNMHGKMVECSQKYFILQASNSDRHLFPDSAVHSRLTSALNLSLIVLIRSEKGACRFIHN